VRDCGVEFYQLEVYREIDVAVTVHEANPFGQWKARPFLWDTATETLRPIACQQLTAGL
jgi:hypothetical protein